MANVPVFVRNGLTGTDVSLGSVFLRPNEVGLASEKFSSTYILRMGLHFDRYVISGSLPSYAAVQNLYSTSVPAANATHKTRAQSVTGNIGESLAAIVARRKLGSRQVTDVLPLTVSSRKKTPDFHIRLRPRFPTKFQTATGINPTVNFDYWPVESKASQSTASGVQLVKKAILQLGSYWFEREQFQPDVVGYGLVVCFVYRGTVASPMRRILVHVFTPANQPALRTEIQTRRTANDKAGFINELKRTGSTIRGYVNGTD